MVKVDESLTRSVAELARLELTSEEVKEYTEQLQKILEYIDLLQKVSVKGVEPLMHPFEMALPLREDKVEPFELKADGASQLLDSAAQVQEEGFQVPSVMG